MLVLALAIVLVSAPGGRTPEAVRLDYEQLLEDYRHGDGTTVARVAAWPHDELKAAVADLEARVAHQDSAADVAALRVAAVLHADASFALDTALELGEGSFQRALGRELLAAAGSQSEPSFECSWWLAVAYHSRAESDLIRMAYGEAGRVCGERPELWLAFGALSEFLFSMDAPRNADFDGWPSRAITEAMPTRGQKGQEILATSYFRRAVKADPQLWEARLRLGRILSVAGKTREGSVELRAALVGSQDPQLRYLAHLFLGDSLDKAGRGQEAVAHFRSAVEIAPSAGSGAIALSRALFVAGDAAAARSALNPYLARDVGTDVTDPWLSYSLGVPIDGAERALERLRAAVRLTP